jgi:hypothetical protein
MRNPYIAAVERRLTGSFTVPCGGGVMRSLNEGELKLLTDLLKELQRMDKKYSLPVVSKLRHVADACEAGGHKSRAKMFRALAKEFEVNL